MEEEEEVHAARDALLQLRKLFPELLTRCQLVGKWREVLKMDSGDERARKRLADAETERDALRSHLLETIDENGTFLQDLRLLVTACVSLDDKMMEIPVTQAVANFCRSCTGRRTELLKRIKEIRSVQALKKLERLGDEESLEKSDSTSTLGSESDEALLLRDHLMALLKLLERLLKCDKMLSSVRAARYITKFEDERASIQMEKKSLLVLLERWCERNSAQESELWREQNELVSTIITAMEVELNGSLLNAIQEDIDRFAFSDQWFPVFAKQRARRRTASTTVRCKKGYLSTIKTGPQKDLTRCLNVHGASSPKVTREGKDDRDEDEYKGATRPQKSPRRLPIRNAGFSTTSRMKKEPARLKEDKQSISRGGNLTLSISGHGMC